MLAQGDLSTFPADVPGESSAQDAARDCARRQQPWVAVVRNQPQQQQIGAAGNRERNWRRIDDRYGEEAKWAKLREPVRHRQLVRMRGGSGRRWGK